MGGRRAVVLFQMGGPENPGEVEAYLRRLFSDPLLFDLPGPGWLRGPLARFLASRRAGKTRRILSRIGGKSPLNETTRRQARTLEERLAGEGEVRVVVAMRYTQPDTREAVGTLAEYRPDSVVLLPLYPQYCRATTGSSLAEWDRSAPTPRPWREIRVLSYCGYRPFLEALAERVREGLDRFPRVERDRVHLLFSAHGIPERLRRRGDPYVDEVRETVRATLEVGGFGNPWSSAFQSRVGPLAWVRPSVTDELERLAREGGEAVLVVPVSFVSDHTETLVELGMVLRERAERLGLERFELASALDDSPRFVDALADLVRVASEGGRAEGVRIEDR
jgi:ferrochelatase